MRIIGPMTKYWVPLSANVLAVVASFALAEHHKFSTLFTEFAFPACTFVDSNGSPYKSMTLPQPLKVFPRSAVHAFVSV